MKTVSEYRTISGLICRERKERKSLFISLVYPVETENDIELLLQKIKKEYYDANHRCYAYKLLNGKTRFADDGEPHHTAGLRIFNAIEHFDLNNVLVVVVRYFGGTKLGVGPLGKAYYDSAYEALKAARILTLNLHDKFILSFDFSHETQLIKFLKSNNAKIVKQDYLTEVTYECLIPSQSVAQIIKSVKELTNGKIQIEASEEKVFVESL
ncbi:MAG: YigZ family protein [Ignavibacteriales bacterium]|nr:MAG: YigZ family protein [Ignavibacteriales bacterium]